jgi:hypothetical protein
MESERAREGARQPLTRKAKMSHITTITMQIKDLKSLARAAKRLGLEFREGQRTQRYYSNKTNACDHAIAIPNNSTAYEIGVVAATDGTYTLAFDDFMGGKGMMDIVGKGCCRLKQAYTVELAKKKLKNQGYTSFSKRFSIYLRHPLYRREAAMVAAEITPEPVGSTNRHL